MQVFDEQNDILNQEDYFKGYKEKIDALKSQPHVIEFDKLCYELFEANPQGKRFIEIVKEKYLLNSLAKIGTPTYQVDVIWADGFKEFPRMILQALTSHQQRIMAGNNK